jgi:hypothetical protein
VAYPLACLFAEEGEAAASTTTEAALAVARGFDDGAGEGCYGSRFVINIAIAAEVAGIVEDDGFCSPGG